MLLLRVLLVVQCCVSASNIPPSGYTANRALQQAAVTWYESLNQAMNQEPRDDELIYRLCVTGLVYNLYQQYDVYSYESIYLRAIHILSANRDMLNKLLSRHSKWHHTFRKLYHNASPPLREHLLPLALRMNWTSTTTLHRLRESTRTARELQVRLLSLKHEWNRLDAGEIASVFSSFTSYLRHVVRSVDHESGASPSWIEIEITITIFQLATQNLAVFLNRVGAQTAAHYVQSVIHMAMLTAPDLKQACKVMDIITEDASEWIDAFMATRQQLLARSHTRKSMQYEASEMIVVNATKIREISQENLPEISALFLVAKEYLRVEAESKNASALVGNALAGHQYQFALTLFGAMMKLSKAVDVAFKVAYKFGREHVKQVVLYTQEALPFDVNPVCRMNEVLDATYPEMHVL